MKGWDPTRGRWVERIYYAGAADNLWGPYTIGFLEWDGKEWIDQPEPAFTANEDWEHGSVYEPNLIYHGGKWKMWYVAGSNHDDYLIHGYAESDDGATGWSKHAVFAGPDMKMFDFCVRPKGNGIRRYLRARLGSETVRLRLRLVYGGVVPSTPHGRFPNGVTRFRSCRPRDRGWHSGPWKPSFQIDERSRTVQSCFLTGYIRPANRARFRSSSRWDASL